MMTETLITGIGSLPFREVEKAMDVVLKYFEKVPFWPQLPRRSPFEDMFIPFLSGLPFFSLKGERLFVDKENFDGLEEFYDDVENGRIENFSIPYEFAPGFYHFLERVKEVKERVIFVKAQITGPFTSGLSLKWGSNPIIYDPDIFDVVKKGLKMRAKWMIKEIKSVIDRPIILFFDEPYLSAIDSFFGEEGKKRIREMFLDFFSDISCIKGMHICGNTDWPFVLRLNIEILNFDAFNFFTSLSSFEERIREFYIQGGTISPGIVPSEPVIKEVSLKDLLEIKKRFLFFLSELGIKIEKLLLTPSCGLALLSEKEAERAIELLSLLARDS